jgi:hypothetical protein
MLTVVAILVVLLSPAAVVVGLLLVIERRARARAGVVARQIMLTDAVHAELGFVVSPVVEKRAFRPWRVVFAIPTGGEIGRLVAITERVLGGRLDDVHIVFTRPAARQRTLAA